MTKKVNFGSRFGFPGGCLMLAESGLFNLQRLTPAGVGGFWHPWKSEGASKIDILTLPLVTSIKKTFVARILSGKEKINDPQQQKIKRTKTKMKITGITNCADGRPNRIYRNTTNENQPEYIGTQQWQSKTKPNANKHVLRKHT